MTPTLDWKHFFINSNWDFCVEYLMSTTGLALQKFSKKSNGCGLQTLKPESGIKRPYTRIWLKMSIRVLFFSLVQLVISQTFTELKYHPVEIIAKMLKSFWAVNKTGLNSYSVSNIMMIDFKLNRQFWKQFYSKATTKKTIDIGMLQRLGIQVLSAIIIHFVIVWPISTAFLWFSCDRLDGTR